MPKIHHPRFSPLPLMTEVYGGTAIPDEWQTWSIKGFRDCRTINEATQFDRFAAVELEGDSLMNEGILPGDILIFRMTNKYKHGHLGIWQTPHGRTAKYASYSADGSLILHNNAEWQQRWLAEQVQLLGVVVRVERDLV